MIDHVSIGVRDLEKSGAYYQKVLATLGYSKLVEKPGTIGFGKKYAEFWLNHRPSLVPDPNNGTHVCLRCGSVEAVVAFHEAAINRGGAEEGAPGFRPEYNEAYFAAFITDADGNKIEAVTFVEDHNEP